MLIGVEHKRRHDLRGRDLWCCDDRNKALVIKRVAMRGWGQTLTRRHLWTIPYHRYNNNHYQIQYRSKWSKTTLKRNQIHFYPYTLFSLCIFLGKKNHFSWLWKSKILFGTPKKLRPLLCKPTVPLMSVGYFSRLWRH